MTPTYKYDPTSHCLREVARMKRPTGWANLTEAYRYDKHLASLRVIPCAPDIPDFMFKDGEEDKAFYVIDGKAWPIPLNGHAPGNYYCTCSVCNGQFIGDKLAVTCKYCAYRAYSITTQSRLYTQAEAEEIFKDAYRLGMTYKMALDKGSESPLEHEQQQYFKTRFNVEL